MMTEQMSERMSENMMKCQRCEGLLVRDSIYNLEGQFHRIEVLRCLNCGETVDATILKAREGKNDQRGMRKLRFSARHAS